MKMFRGLVVVALVIASSLMVSAVFADIGRDDIVEKAKQAAADQGIAVVDCNIVYDEENKTWEEWGEYIQRTPNDNNHGNLPHGILESMNYQAVYFDFYDDAKKDVWVFVDPATGDALLVYEKK